MHLEIADANQKLYVCPGETEPISHAVHLGRLARFYPACQACPLNCETGATAMPGVQRLRDRHTRELSELQISHGRIRGVYLNHIDRRVAGDVVGQFAAELWSDIRRSVQVHRREQIEQWTEPLVVIGYDQRPSSPDIVTGVQDRLRLMGCTVVDLGLTTGPALQYAIRFHRAASGVFVSGSGHSAAWTGLDFYNAAGFPRDIAHLKIPRAGDPPMRHARPVRWSGQHSFKPIGRNYALRLRPYVRTQKAMTVCVGVQDDVAQQHIESVLAPLGDGLQIVRLPKRVRNLRDADDADTVRVARAVLEVNADMGFVVDEDLRHCVLIDDFGDAAFADEVADVFERRVEFIHTGEADVWRALQKTEESDEPTVFCGNGLYAFSNQQIACDAAITIAHFVTCFSRQERSVGDFVADAINAR